METHWIGNVLEWVNAVVSLGANLFFQSALLAGAGLVLARLLRRHGAANRSAVLRMTLALVLLCPLATLVLDRAGIYGMAPKIPLAMIDQAAVRFADDALAGQAETSRSASGQSGSDQSRSAAAREPDGGAGVAKLPRSASAASHAQARWTLQPLAWLYIALSALWLAGAAFLALRLAVAHVRMARLRWRSAQAPEAVLATCRTLARDMGVRMPQVLLSPTIQSPCLVGLARAAILLPEPSEGEPPAVAPEVIVHELAHRLRGDCAWNLLGRIACAALFFQPLVWLLMRRTEEASDEVADDCVLQRGLDRGGFARTLLAIAERSQPASFEVLASQGVVSFRSSLGRRVACILDPRRQLSARANRWAVAFLLALGLALLLLACQFGLRAKPRFYAIGLSSATPNEAPLVDATDYTPPPRVERGQPADAAERDRIRQQIYLLRVYTMSGKTDIWAGAMRELITIGRPAVPELSAELRRGGRPATQGAIAIVLRAIGDPRATPALIHALGQSDFGRSDMGGLIVENLDLLKCMIYYDHNPEQKGDGFSFGRPIREITLSLEALTKHSEGHDHLSDHDWRGQPFHGSYERTAAVDRRSLEQRDATVAKWQAWWQTHQGEFLQPAELAEAKTWETLAPGDPVEDAGVAAFGPLIPHGPGAVLGSVVDVTLSLNSQRGECLNFMTGQIAGPPPELLAHFTNYSLLQWRRQNGMDAQATASYSSDAHPKIVGGDLFSMDCTAWRIANDRWAGLDAEIRGDRPVVLGKPLFSFRVYEEPMPPPPYTFLFRTGAGDAGALQILGLTPDEKGLKIRYRMVETASHPKAAPAAPAPQ